MTGNEALEIVEWRRAKIGEATWKYGLDKNGQWWAQYSSENYISLVHKVSEEDTLCSKLSKVSLYWLNTKQ